MTVRVRFAPSPTGPLHIGGLRTALYNYLIAKKYKGAFILRIEDTDTKREVKRSEKYILEALSWAGLNPDEGPVSGGSFGPYRQSERKKIYDIYAKELIKKKAAYLAFDSEEDLKNARARFEKRGEAFTYNFRNRSSFKNSLSLSPKESEEKKGGVVRLKVPENKTVSVRDEIRGKIIVDTKELEDKVLIKHDGSPTYHFANVVDDHLMKISHVIRGEEWLPSLPVHKLLYDAFSWEPPKFMHLPLILNPAGEGKLSKRDGEKGGFPIFPLQWEDSLGYKEKGFLPEGMINYLALLGWSPESEKEIFQKKELVQVFNEKRVHKGGARYDFDKALWFNQKHIQNNSAEKLAEKFPSFFLKLSEDEKQKISLIALIKDRTSVLTDFEKESSYFLKSPKQYDLTAFAKLDKKESLAVLTFFLSFADNDNAPIEKWKKKLLLWGGEESVSVRTIMQTLRLALVGSLRGPELFSVCSFLGKSAVLTRIISFIKFIENKI